MSTTNIVPLTSAKCCIAFFWNSFHSTPIHSPQATLHIIANVWSIFRPKIYLLPVLALNSFEFLPYHPSSRPLYIFGIVVLLRSYPIILLVRPRKTWQPFFENEPQPIHMCQLVHVCTVSITKRTQRLTYYSY